MQIEMHQSERKLNWHCVLNTNQLAGYNGKTNGKVQVIKRTLSVYIELSDVDRFQQLFVILHVLLSEGCYVWNR